ncbi:MAG: PD40 domain-containing protein [Bryobacterales bacterium]|nr:PD40 domain-containing protein [Bryobacterales bacterium]
MAAIRYKRVFAAALCCAALWAAGTRGIFEGAADIGDNPRPGATEFNPASGEYRITGGGANIWGNADAFQFAYSRISGDVTITADIAFVGAGAVAHRKAVLMVRQDLQPGSAYADAALHGDGLTSLQFRPEAGAATSEIQSAVKGPTRVRLVRRGNSFTIFAGKPGGELAASGPVTVVLKDPVYLGIGVCSHDANVLETAVFSNVQVQRQGPPAAGQRFRSKVTVYDLATRTSRTVYEAGGIIEAPNWSRDGGFLLINTGGDLYRLPVDGTSEPKPDKIELSLPGLRCNNDHDFSFDGKLLAFSASSPASKGSQVYVANADGTNVRLLTPAAPSYFHGWSPDGRWLVFVGQREGKFSLFRVPVEGGAEQRLTSAGAYDDGPEYSPDGKWIYFNSNRSGAWEIWRIPADGGGAGDVKAQRITNDGPEDWFPHISPDGKRMVWLAFPQGTAGHDGRMEGVTLRSMAVPGDTIQAPRIETLATFFGGQGSINVNSWAPDSRRFAFVVYEPLPAP